MDKNDLGLFTVGCENCGVKVEWMLSEHTAVELWNRRMP
jgi:hypothetical protein